MKTFTPKGISDADLKAAQQLKDSRDFIYQTNQRLQDLNNELVSLTIVHEKTQSKFVSEKHDMQIEFEKLLEEVVKKLGGFFQRIGDLESECMAIKEELDKKIDGFCSGYMTKEAHVKSNNSTSKKLDDLNANVDQKNAYFETELSKLRSEMKEKISSVRKEIPSIEEFKPLKKNLEDVFENIKIDFMGVVREIELLKKSSAYDQKKFENIYTLIDRLKAGKQ